MDLYLEGNAVGWRQVFNLSDGDRMFGIVATDIRRERTGLHAEVCLNESVGQRTFPLASDNFNVSRDAERTRLANSAYKALSVALRGDKPDNAIIPPVKFKFYLDEFCRSLPAFWEEQRYSLEWYSQGDEIPTLEFVLRPYIIEDGLTIIFAGPGVGKSYLCLWIGIQVALGRSPVWTIPKPRYVAYINLERPKLTIKRRYLLMLKAMGIEDVVQMEFFNAVGSGLPSISRKLASIRQKYPDGLFILDSLSRTAMGKLVDDDTGNRTVDAIRAIGGSWLVIGHTSRQGAENPQESHLFGGIMPDCGSDVMLRLVGQTINSDDLKKVGLLLTVGKANDIATDFSDFLALEFEPTPDGIGKFRQIRASNQGEFPELAAGRKLAPLEKIKAFLDMEGEATASQIAKETDITRTNVYKYLRMPDFIMLDRKGRQGQAFYALNYGSE